MFADCPFCEPEPDRRWLEDSVAIALRDAFPVAEGHTLVVPVRHVASIFDLALAERADLWRLVGKARDRLQQELRPHGFNIGLNGGCAAGQTVMHAHVHIIPRFLGDAPDPRGGIRWVVAERARYW